MPPTQKGLVGSVTGQERVPYARESEITGGSCQRTRGDRAANGWCTHATCWRHVKCTTKRTSGQRECQFTDSHKSQRRGQCAWVWLLGGSFFLWYLGSLFYYFLFSYTSRRCTLSGSYLYALRSPTTTHPHIMIVSSS